MASNSLMHPRNIYKSRIPNFTELAKEYPEFATFCDVDFRGQVKFDFKNADAVRMLSWVLLKNDFGLDVELPPGTLVPRIPLRLNYILWLEDILKLQTHPKQGSDICGVDIGTGGSCVYPLLGAKQCGWKFLATEKDADSVAIARRNIEKNSFSNQIHVVKVEDGDALCPIFEAGDEAMKAISSLFFVSNTAGAAKLGDKDGAWCFDFCMCNPPFYEPNSVTSSSCVADNDHEDVIVNPIPSTSSHRPYRPPPHSATVARTGEVATTGGEVGFVSQIIKDSLKLRQRVRIYTSMVGRKSSLKPLKAKLREAGVVDWVETVFCQGRTFRWALAWTFSKDVVLKLPDVSLNPMKTIQPPRPIVLHVSSFSGCKRFGDLVTKIVDFFLLMKIGYRVLQSTAMPHSVIFSCYASQDTWSHIRQKRRVIERLDKQLNEKFPGYSDRSHKGSLCFEDCSMTLDDVILPSTNSPNKSNLLNGFCDRPESSTEISAERGTKRQLNCDESLPNAHPNKYSRPSSNFYDDDGGFTSFTDNDVASNSMGRLCATTNNLASPNATIKFAPPFSSASTSDNDIPKGHTISGSVAKSTCTTSTQTETLPSLLNPHITSSGRSDLNNSSNTPDILRCSTVASKGDKWTACVEELLDSNTDAASRAAAITNSSISCNHLCHLKLGVTQLGGQQNSGVAANSNSEYQTPSEQHSPIVYALKFEWLRGNDRDAMQRLATHMSSFLGGYRPKTAE